ncbi:hypothetical protein DL771_002421 [Monosporascus sp. 5C6A]|nr:hypothetical protein DL771_002421 [Monosporascus sp. 5C6A]
MASSELTPPLPPVEDDGNEEDHQGPARKRQRVRLSCLECRRRKLSCSRELPCDRCIKSGTPDRCNYESRSRPTAGTAGERSSFAPFAPAVSFGPDVGRTVAPSAPARPGVDATVIRDVARDHERIQKLELEVAQLRAALSKQSSIDGSTAVASPATLKDGVKETPPGRAEHANPTCSAECPGDGFQYKFIKGHDFKTRYYSPFNTWSSIRELTGISPFMKETAAEWLRPLNISVKDRNKRREDREKKFAEPDPTLEALLPSKEETDALVTVYLEQFEQIHRILHIPTFKKEYAAFWDSPGTRSAAFTALILAMIAVSSCLDIQASNKFVGIKSSSYQTAEKWVKFCDEWYVKQSHKHRRLIHYQIVCLSFLAKTVNIIKKKRFWTEAGALVREGVALGLHQDLDHMATKIPPYWREMRRRIWATIVEFDVQASFEQGVPTLLSQIHNDADAPRNINDDDFDEDSLELPEPRPSSKYTFTSYQNISRQSLPLRLELNRILTGPLAAPNWDQAIRYSELISQEIDALPDWDLDSDKGSENPHKPIMVHTLLHIQLRQYLFPLLLPFLKLRKYNSKYQLAELLFYNAARDIVLMHDRLFQKGIRVLYFLREDTRSLAYNLCNVSLHQPRGSTSWIVSNSQETLQLIEKCITMKEDRILRCGNNDAMGYSSMCAALGLLETHLGTKSPEAAKAASAERFIGLHYKLLAYQIPPQPQADAATSQTTGQDLVNRAKSATPFPLEPTTMAQLGAAPFMPWVMPTSTDSSQVLTTNPDFNLEMLGTDLNDLWGDWPGGDF